MDQRDTGVAVGTASAVGPDALEDLFRSRCFEGTATGTKRPGSRGPALFTRRTTRRTDRQPNSHECCDLRGNGRWFGGSVQEQLKKLAGKTKCNWELASSGNQRSFLEGSNSLRSASVQFWSPRFGRSRTNRSGEGASTDLRNQQASGIGADLRNRAGSVQTLAERASSGRPDSGAGLDGLPATRC